MIRENLLYFFVFIFESITTLMNDLYFIKNVFFIDFVFFLVIRILLLRFINFFHVVHKMIITNIFLILFFISWNYINNIIRYIFLYWWKTVLKVLRINLDKWVLNKAIILTIYHCIKVCLIY